MKQYELCYIISDEIPEKETDLINQNVKKSVEDLAGKIVSEEIWGRKKLAYPINGKDYGFYVFCQVEAEPDKILKLESNLRLIKEIIRHLVAVLEPVKAVESKKEKPKKAAKVLEEKKIPAPSKEEVGGPTISVGQEVKEKKVKKVVKPAKKVVKKIEAPKAPAKPKLAEEEKAEEERMAELDEKLKEILKE